MALHGVNWRGQHLAVNLPLLSLLLVIPFGVDSSKFISYLIRRTFCRFHKVTLPSSFKSPLRRLLFLSSWPPLLLLSAIPHQEPRFLLPLLIPFLVLYSSHAFVSRKRIAFWITLNTFLAAFYCFIHQSGVTRSLLHLQPLLHSDASDRHSTCTFFHTYLPPQHLLAIPNHMSTIDFHDLSQQTEVTAIDSLFPQLNSSGHHFLVSPGSVRAALQLVASKSNIRLQPVRTFFPTFNFESLRWPSSIDHNQLQSLFSTDIWRLHFTTLTN